MCRLGFIVHSRRGIGMPIVSPRMFWAGLAGLASASLFTGLLLWSASVWDASEENTAPIHTPEKSDRVATDHTWRRRRVYDSFPPLLRFAVATAQEAGSEIADDEFVLGLELDGE